MILLRLAVCAAASWILVTAATAPAAGQSRRAIIVFAASDLGPVLQQIVPPFEKTSGATVTVALGSSGTLAQQIRNGAPADVFFAANESYIDDLIPDGRVEAASRIRYARGRLVVATLKAHAMKMDTLQDLTNPEVHRISIANPRHAPYGVAAQQALEATGLWKNVEPKLVFGENVQQAVQFVRSGAVDAGIFARSLADAPDLSWHIIDDKLHAPLSQMAAIVARGSDQTLARSFLAFVTGTQGRRVMRQFGFLLPGEDF
jgi:molybdate transport system substrate-binding protein